MHTIFLALGSNVGNSEQNIADAINLLSKKISKIKSASIYRSKAVGYTDQPDFFNTAVRGETELDPLELLTFVKEIEQEIGRIHRFRWGPREIDIDIIFFNNEIFKNDTLEIPHPRAHERDFVLEPLLELDPEYTHPISKLSVSELLNQMPPNSRSIFQKF